MRKDDDQDKNPESTIICGECNNIFLKIFDCEEHMKTHPSQCYKCDFKLENREELNSHEIKEHMIKPAQTFVNPNERDEVRSTHSDEKELFTFHV